MLVFDAARRALTNCLKGWTITALTSDIFAPLRVAAVAVATTTCKRQLHGEQRYGVDKDSASVYSSSGLQTRR